MKNIFKRDEAKLIYILIAVIAFWIASWALIDAKITSPFPWIESNASIRGLFGDKFGAVNSLFSGLAFAAIIFTIFLQMRELSLQREEVQKNRQQVAEQNKLLSRQRFETTFFNLLELQSNMTAKLDMLSATGWKAHSAFQAALLEADSDFCIYKALGKLPREMVIRIRDAREVDESQYPELNVADISTLTEAIQKVPRAFETFLDNDIEMHRAKIKAAYEKTAAAHLENFSHYFRCLYNMLRFVHDHLELDASEKKRYASILRSQLSDAELICLFYNSLMPYEIPGRPMELGFPKLGKLLKEYDILHNMNHADVIHRTHLEIFSLSYKGEK